MIGADYTTNTGGGFMQLIILIVLWVAFFYRVWPAWIEYYIKHRSGNIEKQSDILILAILFMLITLYVTLVLLGQTNDRPWQQPGTAFNALLITAAIAFTAIKLFPPTFHAVFSKVINYETGEGSHERIYNLIIPRGEWHPISMAMVNTGTFTWENYRVGIKLPNDFEIKEYAEKEFPHCKKWDFMPKPNSLTIGRGLVQKKSTSVMTIGETLANRFFVKANHSGVFDVKIMMTCAGRIGERRQSLKITVSASNTNEKKQERPKA